MPFTVTAQRRSESLQTVPIAITAVSAAGMERNGVHELGTLATRVPGLTFSPFAAGQNIVSLRGVSSNDDGAGTDNSVAVFVDDVYLGRVSNISPEMYDVDRVEVLRGPQGTLYGKNTIGGAINIISSRPAMSNLNIDASADVGNFSRHNFPV
ncbi:MAG TPA: TonB-dependent receptor plug domain-containing protein [Steroidobacteraceae bacterium]|nr:TonB-dependent receptor plug domain-containing protein [Steroidobacteraceae bacterium]